MRSTRTNVAAMAALALCAVSAAGANAQSGDDNQDKNIAVQAPPIHLEQTGVGLSGGKPIVEHNYREMLATCQRARAEAIKSGGTVSVKPLPAQVVGKLGRTYYHIWYDGRRMAVHTDSWDFAVGGLCEFKPIHQAEVSIDQPGEAFHADLTAGTATRQPSDGVVRHPPRPPAAADDPMKAEVMAMLRKQGYGQIAQTQERAGQVAGQPCRRIENALFGSACVWTGGQPWGFDLSGFQPEALGEDVSTAIPEDSIMLSADPANGDGVRWTTQTMSIGGPVDRNAFTVPAGIKIKDAN